MNQEYFLPENNARILPKHAGIAILPTINLEQIQKDAKKLRRLLISSDIKNGNSVRFALVAIAKPDKTWRVALVAATGQTNTTIPGEIDGVETIWPLFAKNLVHT